MSYEDNLPPGCRLSDLPGCSRQDEINQGWFEERDHFEGWLDWLSDDDQAADDFQYYCYKNFWNVLKEDFAAQLHPDAAIEIDADQNDPMGGNNWDLWPMFLFLVLDKKRLEVLVEAYVNSNRDEFEDWVLR